MQPIFSVVGQSYAITERAEYDSKTIGSWRFIGFSRPLVYSGQILVLLKGYIFRWQFQNTPQFISLQPVPKYLPMYFF